MYTAAGSLYPGSLARSGSGEALRAWLRDSLLQAPADVVLSVGATGERHFAAHRAVLAANSGYLKAALLHSPPALALPNLSPEAFAPLLAFMYSGCLDLTHLNIYSILLAAHLLHMPRALDHCRAFLVHNHAPPPPLALAPLEDIRPSTPPLRATSPLLPTLVKPIPSRKMLPLLLTSTPPNWNPFPSAPVPSTSSLLASHPSLFRAVHPEDQDDDDSTEISVTDDTVVTMIEPSTSATPKPRVPTPESSKEDDSKGTKVVLDVACCDGPVRFHRVLNANYGLGLDDLVPPLEKPDLDEDDAEEDEARHREERAATNSKDPEPIYKCLYCNHTFKSHYCYQKHTRRHINPVTFDLAKLADKLKAELAREVKLLDMNVQYYPCKTCGCKFPSYYFVHKHRRMCHPNEVEQENKEAAAAAAAAGKSPDITPSPVPIITATE